MSDDTMKIAGHITMALYEYMFSHDGWLDVAGERYRLADPGQYEELGENPYDPEPDLPLILARESDGKFFEVEIDTMVSETTAKQRAERLAQLRKLRDQVQARQAGKEGKA